MDWTLRLPEPITVGRRRQLRTLADLRRYILALPRERQDYRTWTYAGSVLYRAAHGQESPENAAVVFRIARMMDPQMPGFG